MIDKKLHVAVRTDVKDKLTTVEYKKTRDGWSNVDLSVDQFVEHIKNC